MSTLHNPTTQPNLKKLAAAAFLAGGVGLAVMGLGAGTADAGPGTCHWPPNYIPLPNEPCPDTPLAPPAGNGPPAPNPRVADIPQFGNGPLPPATGPSAGTPPPSAPGGNDCPFGQHMVFNIFGQPQYCTATD
jgi:hypothetical protein